MYLNANWTYLVELDGERPLASSGICLVDLSHEEDRGDLEPAYDAERGTVECTLGVESIDEPKNEARKIVQAWEYVENKPFNDKFPTFVPISVVDFVRRVCDAAVLDNFTEEQIEGLKKEYHV